MLSLLGIKFIAEHRYPDTKNSI